MEINLFSKCIKELIVENDKVDVPFLGTFKAELMPAAYSDRQTAIHPPYRKMSFHKGDVSLAEGRLLLDKVQAETGVSQEQAGVELGWCLSRLCSELEGSKSCKLPGLGVMRANARNEFFFVPDDDLDIWPDGMGFDVISIKVSEKEDDEIPGQAGTRPEGESEAGTREERPKQAAVYFESDGPDEVHEWNWLRIILIAVGVLLVLFIAASYLFTEEMSPILDRLLYSKEELELLRGR